MNIRLDDETDATAAKSKILLQFEFHNSQYQPNLSRYTAIPVNPPKDGNTLGYQSIGNRGREVTSTIYDQSNRNVAHYLKRWTLIGMETENDKTAVVGETSNSKAIRLEDRLQTINLSLSKRFGAFKHALSRLIDC